MYTFVLMMKERTMNTQPQLVLAVNENDIDILYETLQDTVNEEYAKNFDFINYTYVRGKLVEVALYDKQAEDFEVLIVYDEEEEDEKE